jgi:hypothetical protein
MAQPDKAEQDTFPTEYRINSVRAVRRSMLAKKYRTIVLRVEPEPSYVGSNDALRAIAHWIGRLTPPALRSTLLIFANKPGVDVAARRTGS